MKVAQLRLQQDQKWLITSNCLQREANYHILRVSGLNCHLWAEFQWTLVLIKCIGCWYFHHAGVTFKEKARHLTLRESNLVTCSSQRGFMLVVSLIKIQDKDKYTLPTLKRRKYEVCVDASITNRYTIFWVILNYVIWCSCLRKSTSLSCWSTILVSSHIIILVTKWS